jgi:serine/threonine protein kinase
MEFIDGVSLHFGHYTRNWTLEQAAQFIAMAAEGLHVLHEEGVVHGDIKPDNIMVDEDGNVKIIDFGTSCTPGEHKLVTDFEGPRQVTAGFGAPEMYDAAVRYDKSVDIFGLGATFLQFVMGEAPPVDYGETLDIIRKQPRHLRRFLLKAMHTEPGRRHPCARNFAAELRKLPLRPDSPASMREKVTSRTSRVLSFLKSKWTQLARN